ncbi:MAG: ferric reductase-like transmembrane domain-containing protein [Methanomassiliicoccales archaeon]
MAGERGRRGSKGSFLPAELFDPIERHQITSLGTGVLVLICLSVIVLWVGQQPVSLGALSTSMAKVGGFLAITLLSLNFVLATRWSLLERAFGGLDRLYKVHKVVGKLVILFIILHLASLIVKSSPDWGMVAGYLIPGLDAPATLGILSLAGLALLIALTLKVRLPYHVWHNTHRFMLFPLLLAMIHALWAGSDIAIHPPLAILVIALGSIASLSYLYTLALYPYLGPRHRARVVRAETLDGMTEIEFQVEGLRFHPGQFIFVRFPRLWEVRERFPFSISNAPGEETVRISAKKAGDFTTEYLPLVREGDEAVIHGPYGRFGERFLLLSRDMVWIAGGIGITPFLSMARYETLHPTGRNIDLIWSFREMEGAFHHEELMEESARNEDLHYTPWITGERGRLSVSDLEELLGGREELMGRFFFLCGPAAMMSSLCEQLMGAGVRPRNIVFEDFDLF